MEPNGQKLVNGPKGGSLNRGGRPLGAKEATAKDLRDILRLRVMGYTAEQIGERISRPSNFVTRVMAKHDRDIRDRLENQVVEEKVRQVTTLQFVIQESARSWTMSMNEDPDADPAKPDSTNRKAPAVRPGDVAYLKEIRGALSDQRDVYGINQVVAGNTFNLSQVTEIAEQLAEQHEIDRALEDDGE